MDFLTFHVDSGRNLMYTDIFIFASEYLYLSAVNSDCHTSFDSGKCILLPDAATLIEHYCFIELLVTWREDLAPDRVEDITSKVCSF
jgi:hypothetical protein